MVTISVSSVEIGYGSLSFVRGREHAPASVVREGNVTTHNAEIAGKSDGFDASFQISFEAHAGDHSQFNVFGLRLPIPDKPSKTSYLELELEALRQLAPLLRVIADEIETQIPDDDSGSMNHPDIAPDEK